MPMSRAFFLGAGASCADGFPLTRDIVDGVIHTAQQEPKRYDRILRFLRIFFDLQLEDLNAASSRWKAFTKAETAQTEALFRRRPPDVAELLSLMDVLISDESFVCGEKAEDEGLEPFSTRDMLRVRESISRAVATSFKAFAHERRRSLMPRATDMLAEKLEVDDVVVTTNWDLLLDEALDEKFGTDAASTGTDAVVLDASGERAGERVLARPPLFKLHGSLNWLACLRCTTLYVNPTVYIADLGFYHSARKAANTCDCGMPLRPTLITPTYFKQYRIRHFANIWSRVQQRLSGADDWYFVGYSLPTDDVHIRSLLLKAWHLRRDAGLPAPRVNIITHRADDHMLQRYAALFPRSCVDICGFRAFVTDSLSS